MKEDVDWMSQVLNELSMGDGELVNNQCPVHCECHTRMEQNSSNHKLKFDQLFMTHITLVWEKIGRNKAE